MVESLFQKGGTADGLYKLSVRKGGKHITLTLFDHQNVPFAAICNDNGTSFFVTAFPDGDSTRYMFSTTQITEEKLNIKDLSSKDQRELAGKYIAAAMELRKSK